MKSKPKISPFLWFDDEAEQAANFYISVFKNSKITKIARYGEAGKEHHRQEPGSVMVVAFELDGVPFSAINGGPIFKPNEAISFVIDCEDQAEVDYYWEKLTAGGDPESQQCGWLKDKFGFSWQVVPTVLSDLISDPENPASQRAMGAMMQMKKLDIAGLQKAYDG